MLVWSSRGRRVPAPATARTRIDVAWSGVPSFALTTALVAGLASADGGYYPRVWGVAGLAACAVALAALVGAKRIALGRREWLMLAAMAALLAWTAAAATRPGLATAAVPELERGGLYLAVLWAALLVVRRETAVACLGGLLTGTVGVCSAALALYLFPNGAPPNALEGRLLFQPLGYANAMGILAGMAVILALAFAVHAPQLRVRALAAGSLVPLIVTVAFSASRGAAASVVLALGVVVAADPARRRVGATAVVVLPLPLLAVWASSRTSVGNSHAEASQVARDGRIVAGLIVLLTLALVAIAHAALRDGGRVRSGGRLGLLALGGAGVGLVAAVALGVAKGVAGTLGDRPAYWHAAWQDYLAHPVLGSGSGSFETAWLRYRTIPSGTLDAHNLYLETLAELGPVGLVVLVALLALPLTAAVAARRRHPFAVAAAGAYVAFLAHAAVDWDWEMPVVTVTALVGAIVVLKTACPRAAAIRTVVPALAVTLLLAAATAFGLVGNVELAGSASAAETGSWASAQRLARSASWWQPWSAEPNFLLGETELAGGDDASARQSFRRALALDPQDWRTWYELARVSLGERRAAFLEIARLNPLAVTLRSGPAAHDRGSAEGRTR
jgi:hypothetical protein